MSLSIARKLINLPDSQFSPAIMVFEEAEETEAGLAVFDEVVPGATWHSIRPRARLLEAGAEYVA